MHPSAAELEGLVFGGLACQQLDEIAEHVDQCPVCEETVRLLEAKPDTYIEALRRPAAREFEAEVDCANFVAMAAGIGDELVSGKSSPAMVTSATPLGQLGQYRLLEKLGDGGMGAVYKALHVKLKRVVALKVLPENRLQDAGAIARFEREMEAAGQLQHLNIVAATDAGDHQGTHFLVMEYIAGRDAAQIVERCGRLSVVDACEIIRQATMGLACAHRSGLVHRDVKPSNLMLTPEGTVKVLDLGLALLAAPQSPGELTSTGQVMGTIDYMAPEQVADAHRVDARADIYALGATLYKLLTGVPVYHGPRYSTILQKLRALADEPAPSILTARPELPRELADVVQQLLALDPAARPQSAEAVAGLMARFSEGANIAALVARAEEREMTANAGSSVHSHLDGTIPAQPPVRPSPPVPPAWPAATVAAKPPVRSSSSALPIAVVLAAVGAVVVLPLMCIAVIFISQFASLPHNDVPMASTGGRSADVPLRLDHGSLTQMGFSAGDVRYFQVTGSTRGWVWGTDVYTTDSSLSTAAVHAGVLKDGETGVVEVTIIAGQSSHAGTTRNGVTSSPYGSWPLSMRLAAVGAAKPTGVASDIEDYVYSFNAFDAVPGKVMRFRVTGSDFGSVWGTDVYTTDSNLSAAAVHAGVLRANESGVVRVTFSPGLTSYTGSLRNGVQSSTWGSYSLSYRVERDEPIPKDTPK